MIALSVVNIFAKHSPLAYAGGAPKKRFLGYKWEEGGSPLKENDTLGIYLPPKHVVLWCIERRATFCGASRRFQGTKKIKNTRSGNCTPTPTLYPYSGVSQFWHVGSRAGHNQSYQISTRLVQEFRCPMQMAENRYLPLAGGNALTTVYALTCDTVR